MKSLNEMRAGKNTDREIWRKVPDDYYSPSIHVTKEGGIGINVGGHVLVAEVEKWFAALDGPSEKERKAMLQALDDSMTSRGWIGHGKELDMIRALIQGNPAPGREEKR